MKNLIKKEILGWMNKGIPNGKTIPRFEDILDKFEALVIEEVINKLETNPNPDGSISPNIQHWIEAKQRQLRKLK